MSDLICTGCGSRQSADSHPDPKCLDCGADARIATRCFGCHSVIPQLPKCPRCSLATLPDALYPLAQMLRFLGVDLLSLPDRAKNLAAGERAELESRYRRLWEKVDEAMMGLADLLSTRVNPTMSRLVVAAIDKIRTAPEATPEAVLHAIRSSHDQFAGSLPSLPPFPLAVCKAIHEAASWKLTEIQWRMKAGKPLRGIDETGKIGLTSHAEALAQAYGPEDARFAVGVAYMNSLTYAHSLVLGEVFNMNDRAPVFTLSKAAAMQEAAVAGVPVSVVPTVGVIYAVGRRPTMSLMDPWVPNGFLFVPNLGPSLRIDTLDGLRQFLTLVRIPIQPQTLGGLLHLLLAPFPWNTRITIEGEDIVAAWVATEAKIADWTTASQRASDILGVNREPPQDRRESLTIRLEPVGKRLVYRPGHLEVS